MAAVGAVGAIVGARRARQRKGRRSISPTPALIDQLSKASAELRKKRELERLVCLYADSSGQIGEAELRHMLADAAKVTASCATTPASPTSTRPPTDEEVSFIMRRADKDANGRIDSTELEGALSCWAVLRRRRKEMGEALARFDKSGTGMLEREELREYLQSLNGGKRVSDLFVDKVMLEADVFGDGAIRLTELALATACWHALGERTHGSCLNLISCLFKTRERKG